MAGAGIGVVGSTRDEQSVDLRADDSIVVEVSSRPDLRIAELRTREELFAPNLPAIEIKGQACGSIGARDDDLKAIGNLLVVGEGAGDGGSCGQRGEVSQGIAIGITQQNCGWTGPEIRGCIKGAEAVVTGIVAGCIRGVVVKARAG